MPLIDISPPISPRLAVWPGDRPYSRQVALDLAAGDNLTLSSITATLHLGAHADAPSHYAVGAPGIGARPLGLYFGPCQVLHPRTPAGRRVLPEHIGEPITAPRVLFRTGSFPDPERWTANFSSLSPALIAWLHDRGVQLVGIDTPSIDPQDDKLLESHRAVAERDMAVLEGLILGHVPPGRYRLIALPLRIEGADASPVRAALEPL